MAMSSQVLFYNGPGAGPFCTQSLHNQLNKILDKRFHQVKVCDFSSDCFQDPHSISAVFVPGGHAATMLVQMTEDAKKSLKELFSTYHSSCYGSGAGGILFAGQSHDTFTLESRDIQCIKTTRPSSYLGLYPGKTLAPVFSKPPLGEFSIADAHLRYIHLVNSKIVDTVHILSPAYLDVQTIQGAEILSGYDSFPTAIRSAADIGMEGSIIDQKTFSESLFYQSGKARMVLTGSHPEIGSTDVSSELFKNTFKATAKQQSDMALLLKITDSARQNLLRENFEKLGLHCVPV